MTKSQRALIQTWLSRHEVLFWSAALVILHSVCIPVAALESLAAAELCMSVAPAVQMIVLLMISLSILGFMEQAIERGWQNRMIAGIVATLLLLHAIQPSSACCGNLVAAISGSPEAELTMVDICLHFTPATGAIWFLIDNFPRRKIAAQHTRQSFR